MTDGAGHLFVIDGNLNRLDCDAVLVPIDRRLSATWLWLELLEIEAEGVLDHPPFPPGVHVMRYENSTFDRPQVWLGDIGRVDPGLGVQAAVLTEFIERAARELRTSDRAVPRRLAVNVAGSGRGGSKHDKGSLFTTIVPALQTAASDNDVDVVLVCWGRRQYAAAQMARQRMNADRTASIGSPATDAASASIVVELADKARSDQLVLFLGAGTSMAAGLKSWNGLIDALIARAGIGDDDASRLKELDARDQAELLEHRFGSREAYNAALLEELQGDARYSLSHGLLASLHTRENVTTNYDTLFEQATSTASRRCAVLPNEPVIDQDRWLLKLHGSIEAPNDIVLTRADYLGLPERSGALFGVLQAMLMTRHMLFVGYSLTDDTFHRVMHEVRRARRGHEGPVGTALVLFRDDLLEELWGDVLRFVPMMERPSDEMTPRDIAVAARHLDLVLDQVCLASTDVSSFLLDPTYTTMLSDEEKMIAEQLRAVLASSSAGASPIAVRVASMLEGFGGSKEQLW